MAVLKDASHLVGCFDLVIDGGTLDHVLSFPRGATAILLHNYKSTLAPGSSKNSDYETPRSYAQEVRLGYGFSY
jgi:hypothetical protein